MVGLEIKRKPKLNMYILTMILIINPLLGLWNIHRRLKLLLIDK